MTQRRNFLVAAAAAAGLAGIPTASGQAQAPPKTHLKSGDMAPDFDLPSSAGGRVKLPDLRGKKNVVLAFFPAAFTGG
jgi:cytochrome oxidase Cu insertion factor (SCO1/SenC/PrrC family)